MKILTSLQKLLDVDAHFADHQNLRDNFLVREGNHVHKGLIYIEMVWGGGFAIITFLQGYTYQTALNSCLFVFASLAYFIQYKGYFLASKVFNLFQVILLNALMFYFPASPYGVHINDSVLAFYIPISVGTLIAFQGKERKYGYLFSLAILLIVLFLIIADLHYLPAAPERALTGINYDLLYNIAGSAIATFIEVAYILALNNSLNDRLIKANRELDSFVYSVSHDLRSPLMLTRGLIDISKRKINEKEEVLKYMNLADKSISNLDDIIREILVYSRNSRTALLVEHFDIQPLIREIANGLQTTENSSCTITEEYTGSTSIRCDKGRLDTVLRNIITNSVKYRKKGGLACFVKVIFTNTGNQFTVQITDNGEGIPAASLPHVFEMFYRGTSSAPGTGLGLYICKEILDKLKADYHIDSTEGRGTTFTFTIKQLATQKI